MKPDTGVSVDMLSRPESADVTHQQLKAQLLGEFSHQGLFYRLTGFELAARKFPPTSINLG